nr:hypothetical protein HK105_001838 [Polyrhizophydium stewartii]
MRASAGEAVGLLPRRRALSSGPESAKTQAQAQAQAFASFPPAELESDAASPAASQPPASAVPIRRGSAVLDQFVNNIMEDGKKSVARKIMSDALLHIQMAVRQDPVAYLEAAIDKVSPYVKVMSVKRAGRNIPTPRPLKDRQRFRTGILWTCEVALKGKSPVPAGERIGRELIAIMEGKSPALAKREQVHKLALANRSNVVMADRKLKR